MPTAKVALKPREFGRDVTNAAASSTNAGQKTTSHNVIVEKSEPSAQQVYGQKAQAPAADKRGNQRNIFTGPHYSAYAQPSKL